MFRLRSPLAKPFKIWSSLNCLNCDKKSSFLPFINYLLYKNVYRAAEGFMLSKLSQIPKHRHTFNQAFPLVDWAIVQNLFNIPSKLYLLFKYDFHYNSRNAQFDFELVVWMKRIVLFTMRWYSSSSYLKEFSFLSPGQTSMWISVAACNGGRSRKALGWIQVRRTFKELGVESFFKNMIFV